jgi:hypothetical protein
METARVPSLTTQSGSATRGKGSCNGFSIERRKMGRNGKNMGFALVIFDQLIAV